MKALVAVGEVSVTGSSVDEETAEEVEVAAWD